MKLILVALISMSACDGGEVCQGDHCVCPSDDDCVHDCTAGGEDCHIQGAPGETVDVQCAANEDCHVECSQSTSCTVDCGGSTDCNVTCPAAGCSVTHCVDCDVTCGLGSIATHVGDTATCP